MAAAVYLFAFKTIVNKGRRERRIGKERKSDRVKKTHRFFDSILIIAHNECRKVIELFIVCVVCVCARMHWIGVVHLWHYSTKSHTILVADAH